MKTEKETTKAADLYPGVAVDSSDDNRTDAKLEKERTKVLNNNPRNTDDKDM